ncbi:MAG: glycosyltransferase family 1 protein [Candidatus Omnitrophota bacterium]|jgi:glycosyltransferase involved in cell wall biosynthesis
MPKDKMRLGIDARILSQPMNGVARYCLSLLKGLSGDGRFEVYLFSDTPLREEYKSVFSKFPLILFNKPRLKKYWKNWVLPFQLSKYRIDLYHAIWDKGVPLFAVCPIVMSINDLYSISTENTASTKVKKTRRLIGLFLEALKARKILTISECTKKEIGERLCVRTEKIAVTYLDCDRQHIGSMIDKEGAWHLPYDLRDKEYFISVAGRLDDVRKNVPFLIKSFAKFLEMGKPRLHKLVIVGSFSDKSGSFIELKNLVRYYNIEPRVVFTGYIEDRILYNLIKRSGAMIYASTFEGFGIPLLEAFYLGTPVITSDRSSLPEIASGNSAILIDPTSVAALADAMNKLCDDDSLSNALTENGRKRLEDFNWDKTIKYITSVYYEKSSNTA